MNFCGVLYNPNETVSASFPKVIATVSNPDGTILVTDSQTGMKIMPLDTVTLIGMMSVPTQQITNETTIEFQVGCSDFSSANLDRTPRTTDFEIKNVSEQYGGNGFITGTVTNHTEDTTDLVNLSVLFRKNGEIVYMENTFVEDLRPESATAFQIKSYAE